MPKYFYEVKKSYCNCHPETCSCNDFEILFDGKYLCSGNNLKEMERIVARANLGTQSLNIAEIIQEGKL